MLENSYIIPYCFINVNQMRMKPTAEEIKNYSEVDETKDMKKFGTYIDKLSNIEFAVLFSLVIDEYRDIDLTEILDGALDLPVKEELADLWNFRLQNNIGE